MEFNFSPNFKWKKYSIGWLLYVLAIVITGVVTTFLTSNSTELMITIILQVLLVVFGINRVIYYYNLPNKVYLRMEEGYLLMYRPNVLSKKQIEYSNIKRVVEMKDMILLVMKDGKEEQIHKEWLTEKDFLMLRKELQSTFGDMSMFTLME
ncbi:hypothetical protein ACTWP4_17400 [Gracilibacillus sp. D59]|uniref:hypothetical protein n=1 Tax=Gracilibacillus sp. D59 TaxID=3457434 RepID=UPI003FCE678D